MPRLSPVSRRQLIQRLQQLGFEGPYTGGRHEFMLNEARRLILPNPHRGNISAVLLNRSQFRAEGPLWAIHNSPLSWPAMPL